MSRKTMLVGWDGATFDMLIPWIEQGHLPTVARLMREGASGVLHAFPNMNSAAAWSSIVTGCNPGKHGIFDFGQASLLEAEAWRPVTGADRRREPFWRTLHAAGQRVGVLNVPMTYPADKLASWMISGMDTPSPDSPGAVHPPELWAELQRAGIRYVLDMPEASKAHERDPTHLPHAVKAMVEARTQTLLYLMERSAWDGLMAVYVATDRMQHFYWGEGPLDHPSWGPLLELYQLLDAHLARLIARAGPDTNVILLSDHGFGPANTPHDALVSLLQQGGWLRRLPPRRASHGPLLRLGRRYLPRRLQYQLALAFPTWRQRAVREDQYANVDWAATRAFVGGYGSRVNINLRGRERYGSVPPEAHDALCEEVRAFLLTLSDPDTGQSVVREVVRGDEVYAGPHAERAADLLINWDRQALGRGLRGQIHGEVVTAFNQKANARWRGIHYSEGIFVAWGPDIRPGVTPQRVAQYDVAPTLLYLQGQSIPDDLDGRLLDEIINPALLGERPPTHAPYRAPSPVEEAPRLDSADEQKIEQRLRDLGYLQ